MQEGLSINEMEYTHEDVRVTYTPPSYVTNYTYVIIKNGEPGEINYLSDSHPVEILFNETGIYRIEFTIYSPLGNRIIQSGEYKIDKEAPVINIKEKTYKIKANQEFNFLEGITASDIVDGDLTDKITTNINDLDFSKPGIKKLEYSVGDNAGNISSETIYITVKKDDSSIIRIGQLFILFIGIIIVVLFIKYIRSIILERRFSKFTLNSSKNKSISLLDNLYLVYLKIIDWITILLSKSVFIKSRAKRYDKYIESFNMDDKNNMKFMSRKVVVGIIYLIVAIVAELFNSTILKPYEMLVPFIIGFYTLDIIYLIKYKEYKKKIEHDMLEAISVMNNAFKSGRSISQAIELVSRDLDGPIAKEFKKISLEISLGLDVEVAFKRFSERVKLSETVYLTSSLSVLNKTGGNIIKVFDSIEKNLFSRKKLQSELKALTSSSKLIMYVLIFVPIVFVVFISIINKGFFTPLFEEPLGILLICIMFIIYITYILVVKRVMKIRM